MKLVHFLLFASRVASVVAADEHRDEVYNTAPGDKLLAKRMYLRGERGLSFGEARGNSTESIVGGTTVTDKRKYPFFVHGNGCGATLVAKDVVLSAAHCNGAFWGKVVVGDDSLYALSAVLGDMYIH